MMLFKKYNQRKPWRKHLHDIIFEADTPSGKTFDVILLIVIVISVIAVMLDSVGSIRELYGNYLYIIEWVVTILFSVEYLLRIFTTKKPLKYIISFYGIIDLLSVLPTYLSLIIVGSQYLLVIRILRLLRVFRVLKLVRFTSASSMLSQSLRSSRHKILVFLGAVFTMVVIMGSFMYLIEGPEHGFTSIPRSIYWSIVTLTTVGYGDISPQTALGQGLASIIMIIGYSIIAVPTGIITAEFARTAKHPTNTQVCSNCHWEKHDDDAKFCKKCGEKL